VTSQEDSIRPENLPPEVVKPAPVRVPFPVDLSRPLTEQMTEVVAAFEERYLRQALKKARGHVGRAAEITGLSRRSVSDKIAQYKIDKAVFKKG
jgi:DNA-binding NtrC family response regulator